MDSRWLEMVIEGTRSGEDRPVPDAKPVLYMTTRTIRSGSMTEVEIYPVFSWSYRRKVARVHPTSEAVRAVNNRNAEKRFRRLAEANFQPGTDYAMTLTYAGPAPTDEKQLDRDLRNYLTRVNRARKKAGLPRAKCVGVKERGDQHGRLHHHLLISGGLDRDEMERLWGKGGANCDRIQRSMVGLLRYMTKGFGGKRETGRHRYFFTRNLVKPRITESRTKISIRTAERIRRDADLYGEAVLCRKYPDCQMEEIMIRQTDWMPGCYIYARMRRNT